MGLRGPSRRDGPRSHRNKKVRAWRGCEWGGCCGSCSGGEHGWESVGKGEILLLSKLRLPLAAYRRLCLNLKRIDRGGL